MRAIATFLLLSWATVAPAQQRPPEIDPNTKIEGGADLRSSGANAGTGASRDERTKIEKTRAPAREEQRADRSDAEKDRPMSDRNPKQEIPEHERATKSP